MTMVRAVTPARMMSNADLEGFGTEFADIFEPQGQMKVQYEPIELPSEIMVVCPELPKVVFDDSTFPKSIKVDTSEAHIPTDIKIHGPDSPIPTIINLVGEDIPDEIELVYRGEPIEMKLTNIPTSIKVEMDKEIPDRIILEVPEIKIDASDIPRTISIKGVPETIELVVPENIGIPLIFPDQMPNIEMVYRGSPIEVKISMDEIINKNEDGRNCVMIVPCPRS